MDGIDIGQQIILTVKTRVGTTPTAPTGLTVTIHPPTGSDTVVPIGSLNPVSTGVYTTTYVPLVPGRHLVRCVATGAVIAAIDGHDGAFFDVNPASF